MAAALSPRHFVISVAPYCLLSEHPDTTASTTIAWINIDLIFDGWKVEFSRCTWWNVLTWSLLHQRAFLIIEPRKLYGVFALKSSVGLLYFVFLWYEVTSCNTYGLRGDCIYNVVFDIAAVPVHSYCVSQPTSTGRYFKPMVGAADVHFHFHSVHGRVSLQTRSEKALHLLSKSLFIPWYTHRWPGVAQYNICRQKWDVEGAVVWIHV